MLANIKFFIFLVSALITMPPMYLVSYLIKPWRIPIRGFWCRYQLFLVGIKLKIENMPKLDSGMFIMNHRSWLDILLMEAVISQLGTKQDLCWIGHSNLTNNPFLKALFNLYGNITVERESRAGLVKLLKIVKKPIERKRPIMIFPEGTRNKKEGIGKFKPGAQLIADKFDLKVQPVVLMNTDYFLDTRHFKARGGILEVIFLGHVQKSEKNWLETAHKDMLNVYNQREIKDK